MARAFYIDQEQTAYTHLHIQKFGTTTGDCCYNLIRSNNSRMCIFRSWNLYNFLDHSTIFLWLASSVETPLALSSKQRQDNAFSLDSY
jgi:hypothetical protein